MVLLYGARPPDDLLYRRALRRWSTQEDATVLATVDRATGAWRGHVGVITALIPRAPFDLQHTVALICGPEIMMHVTVQALHRRGVGSEQIAAEIKGLPEDANRRTA